ncbi:allantoinase AllB [Deinococcus sonorensis]|uniref:Allantoinase n=2 Tax=Deinococcus sonorensis TaxID=309891 RepID=A0AAU7UF28_9DEIO
MLDLIVRGGTVVTPEGAQRLDLGVEGGQIVALEAELSAPARQEQDVSGLHLLPGLVDMHVHFNEPGRAHWEGLRSGSAALVAGGGTVFADMPLNSDPPLLDRPRFQAKLEAARRESLADFALWGGLTPDNLAELPELAGCGVIGFKAFMSGSGIEEFRAADEQTLHDGMQVAARLGLPVAVHAESDELTARLSAGLNRPGAGWRDYLNSRPVQAELEAIEQALRLAQETGCALHVVHVSSGAGVALIAEARAQGVDVTAETCPHYLAFTDTDLERLGAVLKCAPPLRDAATRETLWQALLSGAVDTIGSDHSPSSPDLKDRDNPFAIWGGIAGVQSTLPVLLTEGYARRGLPLPQLSALLSTTPARRFRLARKGTLAVGQDADLVAVDLGAVWTLEAAQLQQRWPQTSPYLGQRFSGQPRATWRRGQLIWDGQQTVGHAGGQLLTPGPVS